MGADTWWWCAVRAAVGLPSIEEQIDLALDAQKRRATGGQVGMFDMYSKSAQNVQKEADAQSFSSSFRHDATPRPTQIIPPGKPAQAPSLNISVAARHRKKSRG